MEGRAKPPPDADRVLVELTSQYDLAEPASCELLRRGFNDHYLVSAGGERFVFRLYLNGKYYVQHTDELRFELELLSFLHAKAVPVSHPVPARDGEPLITLRLPDDTRHGALFTLAPGVPLENISEEQAALLGGVVAGLHAHADTFSSPYRRYELDLTYLLDQPERLMEAVLREHGQDGLEPYRGAFEELRTHIRSLGTEPPTYGLIHGDLLPQNIHVTDEDELTLFDFDHCGFGWRPYDLATCSLWLTGPPWTAFLDAYTRARPLCREELEAIPAFRKVRPLWDVGDVLAMRSVWGPLDEEERLVEQLPRFLDRVLTEEREDVIGDG